MLGRNPVEPKRSEGDSRTPEGQYQVTFHTRKTHYTAALGISYPNKTDRKRAEQLGVQPGDSIEIHGFPRGASWNRRLDGKNWTDGCIALRNQDMQAVYQQVSDGTLVIIKH
jgi:murein L,D-transpeptidase YafK